MAKDQREGRNSTLALVELAAGALSDDVPLPPGVILRSDAEMEIWRQFTRARARLDWRDLDLVLLAKAVRVEADIRKHQEVLDSSGPLLRNPKGTPVANPLFAVIDTLQRQQLAIFRSLSLAQIEVDPRQANAGGAAQSRFRAIFDQSDPLLARPK